MKKYFPVIICIIIGAILLPLCLGYNKKNYPNEYYNVYLDEEFLGIIESKESLLKYIDDNTEKLINIEKVVKTYCEDERNLEDILKAEGLSNIKQNYKKYYENEGKECVDVTLTKGTEIEKIYKPLGLEIEKTLTYNSEVSSIEDIYSKIVDKKSFTIKGYQFTISNDDKITHIYVTDKKVFESAVKSFIEVYVGKNEYETYINGSQLEIKTVGSLLENIYIQENITVKEKQISIDNKIYTDSNDLAQFLIYGSSPITKTYKVKSGEMITDIALANEISNQEFLISNPKYKTVNTLISAGTEVNIKQTNPQLNVVIEKYVVEDKPVSYRTIYEYDENKYVTYEEVTQQGSNGLQRVKQRVKIVNGNTVYVEPKGKEILKNVVDKIVVKGEKVLPNVGDLYNWAWPSDSRGYSVSGYEWRIHPVTGIRKFHEGIDIAGMGYNAPVYAANNGTITTMRRDDSGYGIYIVINHNNGYYTLYGHLNAFYSGLKVGDTVTRGQQIGYVGSTGVSTGPHIHFELWKNCIRCFINPWSVY